MNRGRGHRGAETLAPLVRERWEAIWRGAGFGRTLVLRRVAAAMLVGLAAVLALSGGSSAGNNVVVATRDLAPGTVVEADQVTVRGLPPQVVPDGAARSPAAVVGRTLAAPVRRGEPLTDVRLTGSELIHAVSGNPESVSVPLRLADPRAAAAGGSRSRCAAASRCRRRCGDHRRTAERAGGAGPRRPSSRRAGSRHPYRGTRREAGAGCPRSRCSHPGCGHLDISEPDRYRPLRTVKSIMTTSPRPRDRTNPLAPITSR